MANYIKIILGLLCVGVLGYRVYDTKCKAVVPPQALLYPQSLNNVWREVLIQAKGKKRSVDIEKWDAESARLMSEEELRAGIHLLTSKDTCYLPTVSTKRILKRYNDGSLVRNLSEDRARVMRRFVWKLVYDALKLHAIIANQPLIDRSEYSGLGEFFEEILTSGMGRVGEKGFWVNQQNDPAASAYAFLKKGELIGRAKNTPLVGKEALLWVYKRLALFIMRNRPNLLEALHESAAWSNHVILQKLECETVARAGLVVHDILNMQRRIFDAAHYILEIDGCLYTAIIPFGFNFGGLGAYYCGAANDASSMQTLLLDLGRRDHGPGVPPNRPMQAQAEAVPTVYDLFVERESVEHVAYPLYPSAGDVLICKATAFLVLEVSPEEGEVVLGGCCFTDAQRGYKESVGGVAAFAVDWAYFSVIRDFYVLKDRES